MSRTRPRSIAPVDSPESRRRRLLAWYDAAARELPWRVTPIARAAGVRPDPYRVWLSEIMLQQTTVAAVQPYFARFLNLFPDVAALADAPRETVLQAWAGLGYYSRARNLHAAAAILARTGFPRTEAEWRALPGVGPYTAAAIAAIAFDAPANVVDGNVERVMARLHGVETQLPAAKAALRDLAALYVTPDRPGDWAQALMDLGATICTPRAPKCLICPLSEGCAAHAGGAPETFPRKSAKADRPQRHGAVFVLMRGDEILIVRRPDEGLLGGMAGLPTTAWRETPFMAEEALRLAPREGAWRDAGRVRHVFTHFALTLDVFVLAADDGDGEWRALETAGLPTVFKKAALLALAQK